MDRGLRSEAVGHHTDWRHPAAEPGASTNFAYYKRRAQLAEHAKLDFLFGARKRLGNDA